jgi:hypothetical protein
LPVGALRLRLRRRLPGCVRLLMKSSTIALGIDVERSVEFFTLDELACQLPFMHSFPKNCCEVVSALLAAVLAAKYSDAEVARICATTADGGEQHFWVEVANKVVDPTSGQFDTVGIPLVCDAPSPLAAKFSHIERQTSQGALNALSMLGIDSDMRSRVLERLAAKLGLAS